MTLYILNLFDLLTTAIALDMGGVELNPVADFLIGVHPLLFVFCKVAVVGLLILYLVWKDSWKAIKVLSWFYAAIVAWNFFIILLLGGLL